LYIISKITGTIAAFLLVSLIRFVLESSIQAQLNSSCRVCSDRIRRLECNRIFLPGFVIRTAQLWSQWHL